MSPLFVLAWVLQAAPVTTPAADFEQGRTAFERSEYARTIQILRPLLYPDLRLDIEGQIVRAHRMLGVAQFFEGHPEEARVEFEALLALRPDYRFDPILDPPKVVDFFNGILRVQEEKLKQLDAQRQKVDADRTELLAMLKKERERKPARIEIDRQLVNNSFAVSFIPFGAGQFQNGERGKGWLFLGSEALLAGASLGALALNFGLYGANPVRTCLRDLHPCPAPAVDHRAESNSRTLMRVQLGSGALFYGVAVWGIVDALRHYRPTKALGPPIERPIPNAAPPPTLSPYADGHSVGMSATF